MLRSVDHKNNLYKSNNFISNPLIDKADFLHQIPKGHPTRLKLRSNPIIEDVEESEKQPDKIIIDYFKS